MDQYAKGTTEQELALLSVASWQQDTSPSTSHIPLEPIVAAALAAVAVVVAVIVAEAAASPSLYLCSSFPLHLQPTSAITTPLL